MGYKLVGAMQTSPNTSSTIPSLDDRHEFHLHLAGREWTIRHAGMALSYAEEAEYLCALREKRNNVPYGVALWPAAIALAHELAARAEEGTLSGKRILELGAGTGLPGIVAAALGAARVVQTDSAEIALDLCRHNGQRNGVTNVVHRRADWTDWTDPETYDWIIGSDILYAEPMHPHLRHLFASSLAPGGTLLIADPFRAPSLRLLDSLESGGWQIKFTKWNLGEDATPRPVGVFQIRR